MLDQVKIFPIKETHPQHSIIMSLSENTFQSIADGIQTVQKQDDTPGDVHVHISKKRRTIAPINSFALCFSGSMSQIIQSRKLSTTALALMFLLLDMSKFGNLVSVNQAGIALRLGVKQPAVSKAMKQLVNQGIILNLPEGQYFNPQLITKQGLDTVARTNPAAVAAGIAALAQHGMEANWEIPFPV